MRQRSLTTFSKSLCIASEAEEPRSIQQKSVYRKGDAHSIQQKSRNAVRLSKEQPSDGDEYLQNSGAYVVSPRSSATERHSPCGTLDTWNKERREAQKCRTVVLEVLSRDRVSHSGVEDLS